MDYFADTGLPDKVVKGSLGIIAGSILVSIAALFMIAEQSQSIDSGGPTRMERVTTVPPTIQDSREEPVVVPKIPQVTSAPTTGVTAAETYAVVTTAAVVPSSTSTSAVQTTTTTLPSSATTTPTTWPPTTTSPSVPSTVPSTPTTPGG